MSRLTQKQVKELEKVRHNNKRLHRKLRRALGRYGNDYAKQWEALKAVKK